MPLPPPDRNHSGLRRIDLDPETGAKTYHFSGREDGLTAWWEPPPERKLPPPPRNHSGLPAACAGCLIIAIFIGMLVLLIYLGATLP